MNQQFKDGQRIKNKTTGGIGTITLASPFSVRVIWDDYKKTMKKFGKTPSSISYKIERANKLFEPVLDEYAGINIFPAHGHGTMGNLGDASFIGPDGKMKGGNKRSIYKVPKSSIHNTKNNKDLPPEMEDEDEEGKNKTSYINDKSVPKNSIHNQKFGLKELDGKNPMGTVGDASFIGKNGMYKGNSRKPVFKTPKSSIHYKKGKFENEPDFYNVDNWETDAPGPSTDVSGPTIYVGNKSVPKNSIHYADKPDEDRHYISTQEQLGMPVAADGTIDGGPRSRDPIASKKTKKKKFADASKYGYPKEEKEMKKELLKTENKIGDVDFSISEGTWHALVNNFVAYREGQLHVVTAYRDENMLDARIERFRHKAVDILKRNNFDQEFTKVIIEIKKGKEIKKEEKDYDTNIVPKTSIHYGERDTVPGEPKMKFEKVVKSGFVPDELKNVTTQGDWKNNLTKAVMDLTGEAQPKEPVIPVPTVPIGNTPEFPYASETDGSMIYPIPGMGSAIKKNGEWTFGDTPQLPSVQQQESPACQGFGDPSDDSEIDIPCTQKPLIKKLMMLIKNEQKNLHEGIALKGIYEGKVVKLNTIFEGEYRRFKTFVKTNEGKIMKVHFGPKPTEECSMGKKKMEEDRHTKYVVEPRHKDGSLNVKHYNAKEPKSFITGATEDELFDYFFANNKDNPKFQHSAEWKDMADWYKEQGLSIRQKTW